MEKLDTITERLDVMKRGTLARTALLLGLAIIDRDGLAALDPSKRKRKTKR